VSRENGRRRLAGRTVKIAVPTVAALGAGSAIAAGAIPSGDGTINGCYRTNGGGPKSGSLRVVDDPAACGRHEQAISWNQKGPQGDRGPQGIQGPQGPAGPAGPSGANTLMVGGVPLTGGTADIFLEGTGLHGGSTDVNHKDAVSVKAFSFSADLPVSSGGGTGGLGAGRSHFDAFHIEKLYDSSSPTLVGDLASGKEIPTVTVSFAKPASGKEEDFLTYTFDHVFVTSYKQGGSAEPPLLEDVGFTFGSVEWRYTTGSGGTTTQGSWDVTTNKQP
jgi:type VI secretion system Hcp family effector